MNRDSKKRAVTWTIRSQPRLGEIHEKVASEPEEYFRQTVIEQVLKLRIDGGERQAADELLLTLVQKLLHDSLTPVEVLVIVEILVAAVKKNLAYSLLKPARRGRSRRPARLCLEICDQVNEARSELNIPIRDSTQEGQDDAITVVCRKREKERTQPWAYDTVRHYYEAGTKLVKEAELAAVKSIIDASNFICDLIESSSDQR